MSLRSDMVTVVDAGRQLAADLGLRQRSVGIRTRTWTGTPGKTGSTYVDVDVTLSPPPKVSEPPARLVGDSIGQYEAGDLIVTRISRTVAESAMADPNTAGVERIWLIANDADDDSTPRMYRIKAAPRLKNFGWEVTLGRMNRPGGP